MSNRPVPEKYRFPNLLKQSRFYDTGSTGEWVTMEEVLVGWHEMPEEDKAEYASVAALDGESVPAFGIYLENCMLYNGGMLELEEDQLAFEAELEDLMVEEYEDTLVKEYEAGNLEESPLDDILLGSPLIEESDDLLDYLESIEDAHHCP